jgi:hypothetical protein
MQHVYHWKPRDFRGDHIYPLNALRQIHPDLYETQRAKYRGREWLLEERVPLLDLLWNDVVHCATVHPRAIYTELQRRDPNPIATREWFKIPVVRLRPFHAVYFKHQHAPPGPPGPRLADDPAYRADFEPFSEARYREQAALPAATLAHYDAAFAAGRRPLLFAMAPHVLVAGAIDIAGVAVIEWSEAPA